MVGTWFRNIYTGEIKIVGFLSSDTDVGFYMSVHDMSLDDWEVHPFGWDSEAF